MVQFKSDAAWKKPPSRAGAPPVEVPQVLVEWLELTYRRRKVCMIQADPDDQGTQELMRAARIYCERQGKKFHHQFVTDGNDTVLQFRMRDARVYKKKGLPR
jgi:hypothetical protein